jgi:hypothetical protein
MKDFRPVQKEERSLSRKYATSEISWYQVLQVSVSNFFFSKLNLVLSTLWLDSTIWHILKGDFFAVESTCVQKDGARRNRMLARKVHKDKPASPATE